MKRIVALVPVYVPAAGVAGHRQEHGGSELMLHDLLVESARSGDHVEVVLVEAELDSDQAEYRVDDVLVTRAIASNFQDIVDNARPDVVVTQMLPHTHEYVVEDLFVRPPSCKVVVILHDGWCHGSIEKMEPDVVVFNSHAVGAMYPFIESRSVVIYPPINRRKHYSPTTGGCITLINLQPKKGVELFYELAGEFKSHEFLAVKGGWGEQDVRAHFGNVTFQEFSSQMAIDVWSRTRVLLIPSDDEETFGMVGVEAMMSGIPVIASPTAGLIESLGYAGIFAERDSVAGWAGALERLEIPAVYAAQAARSQTRANELLSISSGATWVRVLGDL